MLQPEYQYLNHLNELYHNGVDIYNERTGQTCRTLLNLDMTYDASTNKAPVATTRQFNIKQPIAELLGYLKGVTSSADMAALGTKTWDQNANHTEAWLANPNRTGQDDMGLTYGAVAKNWPVMERDENGIYFKGDTIDLIANVVDKLKQGIDDRGLTITYWNPGMFHLGCLRPCMHTYTFSILADTLHVRITQR